MTVLVLYEVHTLHEVYAVGLASQQKGYDTQTYTQTHTQTHTHTCTHDTHTHTQHNKHYTLLTKQLQLLLNGQVRLEQQLISVSQ